MGIPTINVNADAPSGNAENEMVAAIDTLIQGRQLNPQIGSQSSTVTASGSTFGTGTDVLASALSFTAVSGAKYRLRIVTPEAVASGAANAGLHVNLDGADGGVFGQLGTVSVGLPLTAETILSPSAGAHTVNVRLVAGSGGSVSVGASPATNTFVTLDRIA